MKNIKVSHYSCKHKHLIIWLNSNNLVAPLQIFACDIIHYRLGALRHYIKESNRQYARYRSCKRKLLINVVAHHNMLMLLLIKVLLWQKRLHTPAWWVNHCTMTSPLVSYKQKPESFNIVWKRSYTTFHFEKRISLTLFSNLQR